MRNDETLNILTSGQIFDYADSHHYGYQPTPCNVLDKIVKNGFITKDNIVVDYGCGKGRVAFYLNDTVGCAVTGVEYAEPIYRMAEDNLDRYGRDRGVRFINIPAEDYNPVGADTFYFFNPFSVETVQKVLDKVLSTPTAKRIVFYYLLPHIEKLLRNTPRLNVVYEEDCRLNEKDYPPWNKLMVFDITKEIK